MVLEILLRGGLDCVQASEFVEPNDAQSLQNIKSEVASLEFAKSEAPGESCLGLFRLSGNDLECLGDLFKIIAEIPQLRDPGADANQALYPRGGVGPDGHGFVKHELDGIVGAGSSVDELLSSNADRVKEGRCGRSSASSFPDGTVLRRKTLYRYFCRVGTQANPRIEGLGVGTHKALGSTSVSCHLVIRMSSTELLHLAGGVGMGIH